jgi:integrase
MRYPKPYKPAGRDFYYFAYTDRQGKRHKRTTGCDRRGAADAAVRDFVDSHSQGGNDSTFAKYSRPFFIWESCPRVASRLDEGKQIGRTHVRMMRALLDRWVIPDTRFSELRIRVITRGDLLDLRARLRKTAAGMNSLNKTIIAVKTILSEAAFRGDIPADPGAKVGNIKYEQRQRGVFTITEARSILTGRPGKMKTDPLIDAAVTMLFCTGMRVGELRALRWGSVDLATGRARITEAFKD